MQIYTTDDGRDFTAAMDALIAQMKDKVYTPTYLMSMVKEHGAVDAAHQVVGQAKPTEGFTRLREARHLELTVENLILDPRWPQPMFDGLHELARKRLRDFGFTPSY